MISKKLKSTSGASLVLALLFFMVCAVVGSIIIAAGTASSGRIAGLKESDQGYYTVTSAAKVIRDEINGQVISIYSMQNPSNNTLKKENCEYNQEPTGDLKELLEESAMYVFTTGNEIKPENTNSSGPFKLTMDGKSINATYQMGTDYSIDIVLIDPETDYRCTLRIPAAISLNADDSTGWEYDAMDSTKIIKWTTTLTWADPVITNEGN